MWFNKPTEKDVKNRSNLYFSHSKKDSRTRGHEVTLIKGQCVSDIRKYSFSRRTMHEKNKLRTDCVTASSVFKTNVDTYLSIPGRRFTHR